MLIIALLAGLAAAVLAAKWIQQQSQQGGNKIAVMLLDVQLGSRLTPEMIQLVDWPIGSVPEGAFSDPKALDGRVVRTSLARGEPPLESKLALGAHNIDKVDGNVTLRFTDGTERFLTLGCGLRAVAGQSGLRARWYFVTPQRIGRDLFLQNFAG